MFRHKLEEATHYQDYKNHVKYFINRFLNQKELENLRNLQQELADMLKRLNIKYQQLINNNEIKKAKKYKKLMKKFEKLIIMSNNTNNQIADYKLKIKQKNNNEISKLISIYKKPSTHRLSLNKDINITQVVSTSQTSNTISSAITIDSVKNLKKLSKSKNTENNLILLNEAIKWVDEAIRTYKKNYQTPDLKLTITHYQSLDPIFLSYVIHYCQDKNYQLKFEPPSQMINKIARSKTERQKFDDLYNENINKFYSDQSHFDIDYDYSSEENIQSLYKKSYGNTVEKFYSDSYDNPGKTAGAFNDIFNSIADAKHSILINGWTLSPTQKFTFGNGKAEYTLPEILARKALQEGGPDIVLMIWKNIAPDFSNDTKTLESAILQEIDNLTQDKQERINAKAKLHIRFTDTNLTYSDHAKMVIIDSKKLFMGGLDLTINRGDPQIWHDCHCQIKGPVVQDALDLFYRRFLRKDLEKNKKKYVSGMTALDKAKDIGAKLAKQQKEQYQLKQQQLRQQQQQDPNFVPPPQPSMQFLTSIRKEFVNDKGLNFHWLKGTHTNELLHSQVQAIKAAKNFIYMENQFFVGPRFKVKNIEKIGPNLVILEIFNKIKENIEKGTPFHFYCQLPYRPEGPADDPFVNLILRKQWKTMKWLITKIQNEINANYPDDQNKPKVGDYVTFSNLGFYDDDAEKNQFEMKYTHSKLMIIDDNVQFIGSNNCNERSNKGNRDHEICMRIQNDPEIKTYRQNLMKQHFGADIIDDLEGNNVPPNDKTFYDSIKERLNNNLENYHGHANEIYSLPWGNIETQHLEKGTKPKYVPKKTNPLITAAQKMAGPAKKLPS